MIAPTVELGFISAAFLKHKPEVVWHTQTALIGYPLLAFPPFIKTPPGLNYLLELNLLFDWPMLNPLSLSTSNTVCINTLEPRLLHSETNWNGFYAWKVIKLVRIVREVLLITCIVCCAFRSCKFPQLSWLVQK